MLSEISDADWPAHRHIAEVRACSDGRLTTQIGCGTAIPSCYLLQRTLSTACNDEPTTFTLCDYNEQVLALVRSLVLH